VSLDLERLLWGENCAKGGEGRKVSGYEHFQAVIFCDLRSSKIQSAKTHNELLSSGAYDPSIQKAVSAEVDACDGSKTSLIFDGLNMSAPHANVQSQCLLSRCLRNKYLQGATVFITCDPEREEFERVCC